MSAKRIHFIAGEDDFLVERAAKAVIEAAVPDDMRESAAIERIDGDGTSAEEQLRQLAECSESAMTPPFLEPFKTTWWRNVGFIPGAAASLNAEVRAALEKFVDSLEASPLPDNQLLVITAPKVRADSVFFKHLSKIAETKIFSVERYAKDREAESAVAAAGFAAELGVEIDAAAAEALVHTCGTDSRKLLSELAKMRDWLEPGDKRITLEAVELLASPGAGEPEPWDLTDALGRRDAAAVCRVLARHDDDSGTGIRLANSCERFFRQLAIMRDAADRKLDPSVLANAGVKGAPFQLRKNAAWARNYTLGELRIARWRMMRSRERLVSGAESWRTVLEPELIRTAATRSGGR